MRKTISPCLCLLGLMTLTTSAFAWHKPGHMITALIAYEKLDPATRTQLAGILKHHPRFSLDFTNLPSGSTKQDQERWLFCQASTWPDHVRPTSGSHDGTTPADPQTKTSYHREQWHFINFPIGLLPAGATDDEIKALETEGATNINLSTNAPTKEILKMNVLQAIDFNAAILKNTHAHRADRAVALCWLIHTIGDIHQPLHSSALFTKTLFAPTTHAEGDRGGNLITFISNPKDNLHSFWDDAPGKTDTFHFATNRTAALLAEANLVSKGTAAALITDPMTWAQESLNFARTQTYTDDVRTQILNAEKDKTAISNGIVDLPAGYSGDAKTISDQRVVEGGFRLAAKLAASLAH